MMKTVYFFVLLFLALLFELQVGKLALPLLLPALVIYYVSLAGRTGTAFYLAILFGVVLDLAYGRELPTTTLVLVVSLAVGRVIRLKAPSHTYETALPGMGIALTALLGGDVVRLTLTNDPETPGTFFWKLIFFGAIGLFLMPFLTLLFDRIGGKLGVSGALCAPKSTFDRLRPRRVREPRTGRLP